ncbi:glycosyltransferase [Agromyces sp. SYSU T0242]|uniref:glycosyltransferase n=1 Tax=Agromyces litoreus TaxID=3158561 RepID=UPI00339847D1
MSDRLRILHAIRSDGFSGVEQFVLRLARTQAADGHAVHVIGGDPPRMRPGLDAAGVGHTPAARTIEVLRAVRGLAAEVDVVNTHMTAADVAAVAALATGRPSRRPALVATCHFARARGRVGPIPIDALVGPRLDAQLAISAAVAAAVSGPSTVVHTGIEPRAAGDPAARERTVLMAQRLQPEKRSDVGMRAFAASGLAGRGWTLEVAGIGPEREPLERLAAELGVAASVRFSGYRTDLPDLLARSGLLLAPCPVEGLGLTLLEAMASGLPPVAADAAGHVEVLDGLDPRTRFAADDADAAGARLRELAADPAARAALGEAARARQQQHFSLRAQAAGTEAVYRDAIARTRSDA